MSWLHHLFSRRGGSAQARAAVVQLTNTLSGKKEVFVPLRSGQVLLYSCGPTVYSEAHIGNLRAYVFSDTLARTLTSAGYTVKRVINITDVGHLVGDADTGEDKMALGAARDHTTPAAIADRYTAIFEEDLRRLRIDTDAITFPRATAYIKEQIALAKTLEEKGFAYRTKDGLYYDTSKFPAYGKLGNAVVENQVAGARVALTDDKRNPSDFALWRFAKKDDLQQWDSPWGLGNPGWHVECSAMIRALLGPQIDIHTGGEDHIHIHHNNEIAQSEAATGRTFVRYWMHNAFLTMNGDKSSKSLGNVVYLSDIVEKGYHPLSLRYFFLQAHYRTPLSFSWDALGAASGALERLWRVVADIAKESKQKVEESEATKRFLSVMRDDLATPQALGVLWDALKSDEYTPEEKWGLVLAAEAHLALSLTNPPQRKMEAVDIPQEVQRALVAREAARKRRDFAKADTLRKTISAYGYTVEDTDEGPVLVRSTF